MKIELKLKPDTYMIGKNLHTVEFSFGSMPGPIATLTIDELEELELNLCNLEREVAMYRRVVQIMESQNDPKTNI